MGAWLGELVVEDNLQLEVEYNANEKTQYTLEDAYARANNI